MAIIVVLCCVSSVSAGTYTLDDLIRSGLEHSNQVKAVKEEIAKTDAQVKEAYGGAFPTLNLSANYNYAFEQYNPFDTGGTSSGMGSVVEALEDSSIDREKERGAYIVGDALDDIMSGFSGIIPETKKQSIALTLSLNQPIFAQGKVGLGIKIAKAYKKSLQIKYEEAEQDVRASITKSFYAALLARKNLEIQKEAVRVAGESHRLSALRLSLGKASELDTLTSLLNYKKVLIEHQDARSNMNMAFEALIKQTGLSESVDTFSIRGEFPSDDYYAAFEDALVQMQQQNKKLEQLYYGEEVQKLLVRLAKTDVYPMIYCGGSLGKITQFNSGDKLEWYNDRSVFIGMSLNFSGGLTHLHKVEQARADLRSFGHTKSQVLDGLELSLKNTYEQLETSRERLDSTRSLVDLAEKGYEISRKAYEVGSITLLDFQKRELEVRSARLAFQAAQFDVHSTIVDIQVLVGMF